MYYMWLDDCRNSTFIKYPVFECDGLNDCEDGNDELNCCEFKYKKPSSVVYANYSNCNQIVCTYVRTFFINLCNNYALTRKIHY